MVNANPNSPLVGWETDFTAGPPSLVGGNRVSINAPFRRLAVRNATIDRGRNYELDQVQSGECKAVVTDPLEYLNPANSGSPFNSGGNSIVPYRCLRVWAMWPNQPGSGNIINSGVNAVYDPSFEASSGSNPAQWTPVGGTTTLVVSTAQHFDGAKSMLVTQSAAGAGFGAYNIWRTAPNITYTMSAYVFPTAGCSVTMQVTDAAGVVHASSTAVTSGAWTRLTVTWTAVDTLEKVVVYGTGTSTPTYYVDATQLEFGSSATAFTSSGPTLYMLYNGYIERYPTEYDMGGIRHIAPLAAVDALAILSRTEIAQSYYAAITADHAAIYVPMDNEGSMTTATVGVGMTGAVPLELPNSSNGGLQWGGDSNLDGTKALTINQRNASNPPTGGGFTTGQDTNFLITNRPISLSTAGATVEMWARNSSGYNSFLVLAEALDGFNHETGSYIHVATQNGALLFGVQDPPSGASGAYGVRTVNPAVSGFPDATWHYYAITFYGNGTGVACTVDGSEVDFAISLGLKNIGYNFIHAGAFTGYGDPQSQVSLSRLGIYTSDIGSSARNRHYQRGVGYIGEKSGARVTRLLNQYWAGPFTAASGYLSMAPDFGYDTRTMLDVLQEIQESERGLIYADRTGTLVFEDRSSRYANQAALWVFGENPAGASPTEYPYENFKADFDPTYTFTQANLTRPGNSNFPSVVNSTTLAMYGQRILSQTLQCNTDFDLAQAAQFYLKRYGTPKTRISTLTLHPSANPALWPVVLSLDISQRVTVKRRSSALTTSADYYIEKISHKIDAASGEWTVDLQLSPVFVPTAWKLGDATYGVLGTSTVPVY